VLGLLESILATFVRGYGGSVLSIQAIVWVIEYSESTLGARHVLISIANHADRTGGKAFPSLETIALESRLSESAVRQGIKELVLIGELRIDKRGTGRGNKTIYSLAKMAEKVSNSGTFNERCQNKTSFSDGEKVSLFPCANRDEPFKPSFSLAPPSSEQTPTKNTKQTHTDPRWEEFKNALSDGYKRRGWDFIFNGADGKQLKALLAYKRSMNVAEFRKCLRHYFESEGVIPGAMPHTYLMRLPNFWAGPLNQYGKLIENRVTSNAQEMVV
jgi:hypothetical protein